MRGAAGMVVGCGGWPSRLEDRPLLEALQAAVTDAAITTTRTSERRRRPLGKRPGPLDLLAAAEEQISRPDPAL